MWCYVSFRAILSALVAAAYAGLAGIGWAIFRWKKHPSVSLLVLIALGGLLLTKLASHLVQYYVRTSWESGRPSLMAIGNITILVSIVSLWIDLMSWLLILIAVFGWRSAEKRPTAGGSETVALPPRAD